MSADSQGHTCPACREELGDTIWAITTGLEVLFCYYWCCSYYYCYCYGGSQGGELDTDGGKIDDTHKQGRNDRNSGLVEEIGSAFAVVRMKWLSSPSSAALRFSTPSFVTMVSQPDESLPSTFS